ncbi:hypothetical protein ACRE_087820 [Hapsidospora chrysogenum ATCC 11550]|uniref:Uncharacterized protein n=1 Tax=Hapsidospora chrysogenum (strain ATCC 11550 / CBS 779.69 / DSM 880 / IAM 14645 / JCM 23072 / IMI 49137) TaxID=857340 RepID=A0A086STU6_HAPC1|nr:hypothetical protein ACRE_087820 [Hapsidospora chrysogenum ATCC 11550]
MSDTNHPTSGTGAPSAQDDAAARPTHGDKTPRKTVTIAPINADTSPEAYETADDDDDTSTTAAANTGHTAGKSPAGKRPASKRPPAPPKVVPDVLDFFEGDLAVAKDEVNGYTFSQARVLGPQGKGKPWTLEHAIAGMDEEFIMAGYDTAGTTDADPDHPLADLYNKTRDVLLSHYETVNTKYSDNSVSESQLVRRVKSALRNARFAYQSQRNPAWTGKTWEQYLPKPEEVLACRMIDSHGGWNSGIASHVAVIPASHLGRVELPASAHGVGTDNLAIAGLQAICDKTNTMLKKVDARIDTQVTDLRAAVQKALQTLQEKVDSANNRSKAAENSAAAAEARTSALEQELASFRKRTVEPAALEDKINRAVARNLAHTPVNPNTNTRDDGAAAKGTPARSGQRSTKTDKTPAKKRKTTHVTNDDAGSEGTGNDNGGSDVDDLVA